MCHERAYPLRALARDRALEQLLLATVDVLGGLQRVELDGVDLVLLRGDQLGHLQEQVTHLGDGALHALQLVAPLLDVAQGALRLRSLRVYLHKRHAQHCS